MAQKPTCEPPDAAGDAHVEPPDPALRELGGVSLRVVEPAVAGVDDDVARLEQLGQLLDHRIGRGARRDADHDMARRLHHLDDPLDRLGDGDAALVLGLGGDLGRHASVRFQATTS